VAACAPCVLTRTAEGLVPLKPFTVHDACYLLLNYDYCSGRLQWVEPAVHACISEASARQHLHLIKGRQEGGVLPACLACIRLYNTDHILNIYFCVVKQIHVPSAGHHVASHAWNAAKPSINPNNMWLTVSVAVF
jgi:hypothetical protein